VGQGGQFSSKVLFFQEHVVYEHGGYGSHEEGIGEIGVGHQSQACAGQQPEPARFGPHGPEECGCGDSSDEGEGDEAESEAAEVEVPVAEGEGGGAEEGDPAAEP